MAKITRGEFLGMGALLAGAVQAGEARSLDEPTPLDPPGGEPDLVVLNARVYTMDEAQPRAEAFAVRNGRFVAVGRTSDIQNLASRGTKVIDASTATVTPGFIDTHCHPSGVNELFGVDTNLRRVAEVQNALRRTGACRRRQSPKIANAPVVLARHHWAIAFLLDLER